MEGVVPRMSVVSRNDTVTRFQRYDDIVQRGFCVVVVFESPADTHNSVW
jgi:hypothetical protein